MADDEPQAYPCIFYRDAPAAMAWLSRAFGFQTTLEVPRPNGSIAHAEMSLGPVVIMPGTADASRGMESPRQLGAGSQSVYIYVADPRAHYERAKAAGAEITREYEEKDYGGAGYSARDPEGHEWSFGSYRPSSNGKP